MSKVKPETTEEITEDIKNHPERGLINGVPVICLDKRTFSAQVSDELYRQALVVGGTMGLTLDDILTVALTNFISNPDYQQVKNSRLQFKSEKYGVPIRQIINKIFGVYKAATRLEKLKSD